jgi:AcrR family transcriptional regulator
MVEKTLTSTARRVTTPRKRAPDPIPSVAKRQQSCSSAKDGAATPVRRGSTRPTQAERSAAMRKRLSQATLDCLRKYGYAATTITRIVQSAGVSRGAHVHHYASKAELFQQAAQDVLLQAYRDLGRTVLAVSASDARLETMLRTAWREVFRGPRNEIFLEFLVAARADPELARFLHPLARQYVLTLRQAAEHYLEPVDPKVPVSEIVMLSQWVFRGMAMDLCLAHDLSYFEHYVERWIVLVTRYARARPGVKGPPPPPPALEPVEAKQIGWPAAA